MFGIVEAKVYRGAGNELRWTITASAPPEDIMKKIYGLVFFSFFAGCATPPLYRPAERGDIAAVRALLDAGADPNANKAGYVHETALHMAALNNRLDVARLLIDRGADVNHMAYTGLPPKMYGTPLHYAACAGANAVVQLLLERGADPDPGPGRCLKDSGLGETSPLSLAEGMGHTVAAELIRSAVASRLGLASGAAKNSGEYGPIVGALLKGYAGGGKTIAVAGFSYSDGRLSRDGHVISERFTTELINRKAMRVVERDKIEKVLGELKLQNSGAIDRESAKKVGGMLGADLLVVGGMVELPGKVLELNIRMASVESGEALAAVTGRVRKDWVNE